MKIKDDHHTPSEIDHMMVEATVLISSKPLLLSVPYSQHQFRSRCFVRYSRDKKSLKCDISDNSSGGNSCFHNGTAHANHIRWGNKWLHLNPELDRDTSIRSQHEVKNSAVDPFQSRSFRPVTLTMSQFAQEIARNETAILKNKKLFTPEEELLHIPASCGALWNTTLQGKSKGTLWGIHGFYEMESKFLRCENQCCRRYYDGSMEGIFHKSSGYLFTHGLLLSYLWETLYSGTTFIGFTNTLMLKYQTIYGVSSDVQLDVRQLEWAFLGFITLLQVDELRYTCSTCGVFPSVIGFDGTDLGIPRKWATLPQLRPRTLELSKNTTVPANKRMVISNSRLKSLVISIHLKMTKPKFQECLVEITKLDESLGLFISKLCPTPNFHTDLPECYFSLFHLIGSKTSMSRFVHYEDWPVFQQLLQGKQYNPLEMEHFAHYSPLLHQILLRFDEKIIPSWARPFFQRIYDSVVTVFTSSSLLDDNNLSENNMVGQLQEKDGIVWKAWEALPQRKLYTYTKFDSNGNSLF
jgi:hypothetical protein